MPSLSKDQKSGARQMATTVPDFLADLSGSVMSCAGRDFWVALHHSPEDCVALSRPVQEAFFSYHAADVVFSSKQSGLLPTWALGYCANYLQLYGLTPRDHPGSAGAAGSLGTILD